MKLLSKPFRYFWASYYWKCLFLIIIIGVGGRYATLDDQSFFIDELLTLRFSFAGETLITFFKEWNRYLDPHPKFYYFLVHLWSHLFPITELSIRLISFIFGIGTLLPCYKIAREITNDDYVPTFFLLLVSISPVLVYYSQEARSYMALVFLFYMFLYYFFFKRREVIAHGTLLIFLIGTHFLSLLYLLSTLLSLFSKSKKIIVYLLFTLVLSYVVLSVYREDFFSLTSGDFNTGVSLYGLLSRFLQISTGFIPDMVEYGQLGPTEILYLQLSKYPSMIMFLLIALLPIIKKLTVEKLEFSWSYYIILYLQIFLPIFLLYILYQAEILTRFYSRFLIVSVPLFYLLVTLALREICSKKIRNIVSMIIVLSLLFSPFYYILLKGIPYKTKYREGMNYLQERYPTIGTYLMECGHKAFFKYYLKKKATFIRYGDLEDVPSNTPFIFLQFDCDKLGGGILDKQYIKYQTEKLGANSKYGIYCKGECNWTVNSRN